MSERVASVDLVERMIAGSPFAGHLGLTLVDLGEDVARVAMPFKETLVTVGDIVHGGAISSLLDTTATAAAWSTPDLPENLRGTTVAITVNFLSAARGRDLVATGRVVKRGKSLCFIEVDVADGEDRPVAKGLVTYKLG